MEICGFRKLITARPCGILPTGCGCERAISTASKNGKLPHGKDDQVGVTVVVQIGGGYEGSTKEAGEHGSRSLQRTFLVGERYIDVCVDRSKYNIQVAVMVEVSQSERAGVHHCLGIVDSGSAIGYLPESAIGLATNHPEAEK